MRGVEGEGGGVAENPGPVSDLGESGHAVAGILSYFSNFARFLY